MAGRQLPAGGEGGGDRLGWGHVRILYKAPKDYTKPHKTIQRHKISYKAPRKVYKDPKILDKTLKKLDKNKHMKQA